MVRHLVRSRCFAALVTTLILQGCRESSSVSSDRGHSAPAGGRAVAAAPLTSRPEALRGSKTSQRFPMAGAPPLEQYQTEDPPPWLAELLHAPDPNVRIQALDAWARQPGAS